MVCVVIREESLTMPAIRNKNNGLKTLVGLIVRCFSTQEFFLLPACQPWPLQLTDYSG
jgi:hypothetical protein